MRWLQKSDLIAERSAKAKPSTRERTREGRAQMLAQPICIDNNDIPALR